MSVHVQKGTIRHTVELVKLVYTLAILSLNASGWSTLPYHFGGRVPRNLGGQVRPSGGCLAQLLNIGHLQYCSLVCDNHSL